MREHTHIRTGFRSIAVVFFASNVYESRHRFVFLILPTEVYCYSATPWLSFSHILAAWKQFNDYTANFEIFVINLFLANLGAQHQEEKDCYLVTR